MNCKNCEYADIAEKQIAELKSELNRVSLNEKLAVNNGKCFLKELSDLEKENAELQDKLNNLSSVAEVRLANWQRYEKENAELKEAIKHFNPCGEWDNDVHDCEFRHYAIEYGSQLTKAREIILKLYNAGRDVLMCRAEEKAYDNLDEAINDRSIEQFLKEVENARRSKNQKIYL